MKPFHIADPCIESWDAMRNDGASRHCSSCDKSVHDLSRLTERQIAGLVLLSGGKFCGRQTIRSGDLVVAPAPKRSASIDAQGLDDPPQPSSAASRPTSGDELAGRRGSRRIWPIRAAVFASALAAAACAPASANPPEPVVTAPADPDAQPKPTPTPLTLTDVFDHNDVVMAGMIAYTPPMPTDIAFARGKSTLDKGMKDIIATAADFLSKHPSGLVRIEGHAALDETLRPKRLALQRAEAVKKALVAAGVPRTRLATFGVEVALGGDEAHLARTVSMRIQ